MKSTTWSAGLSVTGDGTGVVAHAGSAAVRMLADRTGPTGALSAAVARRGFVPGHDRGRVLVDVATMIAAGGQAIADIDTLRHQQQVLGPVASAPTVWRALDELTPASLKRIETARAATRARVWDLIPDGLPASRVAGARQRRLEHHDRPPRRALPSHRSSPCLASQEAAGPGRRGRRLTRPARLADHDEHRP